MDADDTFDSVQWRNDDDFGDDSPPPSVVSPTLNGQHDDVPQAGPNADALDLAGVGRGHLETHVSEPQTENEGTKDAFVSYLVATEVQEPPPHTGGSPADHDDG